MEHSDVLQSRGPGGAGGALEPGATGRAGAVGQPAASPAGGARDAERHVATVRLRVNGEWRDARIDVRTSLLDCLRETLQLTGTKKGCDHGQCGACTVHLGGRRVNACLVLAAACDGEDVTTIEGLGTPQHLHPMQAAFVEHDGYQCGYCTSGQIMSAVAVLEEPCGRSDAELREAMSGNICRCGAYSNIIAAIKEVRCNRETPCGRSS